MKVLKCEVQKLTYQILRNPKMSFLELKKSRIEASSQELLYKHTTDDCTPKKKCKNCGKNSYCKSSPLNCKALGKICRICNKTNHYHQGQNCKKFKKEKRRNQRNMVQGCQTLREFLKSICCPVRTGCVQENKIKENGNPQSRKREGKKSPQSGNNRREIVQIIRKLEKLEEIRTKLSNLPITTKLFLLFHILHNLEHFLNAPKTENTENEYANIENYVKLKDSPNDDLVLLEAEMGERRKTIDFYSEKILNRSIHSTLSKKTKDGNDSHLHATTFSSESSNREKAEVLHFEAQPVSHLYSSNSQIPQLDGFLDISSSSSEDSFEENNVPEKLLSSLQVDGSAEKPEKKLAGLISEDVVIKLLVNLFRGLDDHWRIFNEHILCTKTLCNSGRRCLFCHLRSIALRANRLKLRSKRSIQVMEMESQLNHLPSKKALTEDFLNVMSRIIEDISSFDLTFRNSFLGGNIECENCKAKFPVGLFDTIHLQKGSQLENIESIQDIATAIKKKCSKEHQRTSMNCESLKLNIVNKNLLVVLLDGENQVQFSNKMKLFDTTYDIIAFSSINSEKIGKTTFQFNKDFYSSENGSIPEMTNLSKPVKINIAIFVKENLKHPKINLDQFIFNKNSLDIFTKEAYEFTNREKYEEIREKRKFLFKELDKTKKRKEMHQDIDKIRDQSEKRKEMHQDMDRKRNQTKKRKEMNQDVDKKRDNTEKRKEMHQDVDKKRDQAEKRKKMHQDVDKKRDQGEKRKEMHKDVDKKRDQTEKRKEMHQDIDKKRDQTDKRKEMHQDIDKKRDQTDKRKEMHQDIDKKRDQTDKRKEMHQDIDKKRDQTEKRMEMHQDVDKKRDQTEDRRKLHQEVDKNRYQTEKRQEDLRRFQKNKRFEKFLMSIELDTGFDVICCCCIEYKSRYACTKITVLPTAKQKKYLINTKLVVSKDGKRYVCKSCRSQIAKDKIPEKSEKIYLRQADIPRHLKKRIQGLTNYGKVLRKNDVSKNFEQSLELNKLEAHLLKLTLPFIRIAHCPRGAYFKLKGSLIMISADIPHSLSRILPQDQNILPVCFKRKLEYQGNFLEETINKNKVQAYFDFLKSKNPLYKDVSFEEEFIDQFKAECTQRADKFESDSSMILEKSQVEESSSESNSGSEYEDVDDDIEVREDTESPEVHFKDQSTVFCNKYEEDDSVPTVANKLANIIVDFEIQKGIDCEKYRPDKADVNDEINLEEIDMFLDSFQNNQDDEHQETPFEEVRDEIYDGSKDDDRVDEHLSTDGTKESEAADGQLYATYSDAAPLSSKRAKIHK